jgi:hypothetical protein
VSQFHSHGANIFDGWFLNLSRCHPHDMDRIADPVSGALLAFAASGHHNPEAAQIGQERFAALLREAAIESLADFCSSAGSDWSRSPASS